LSTKIFAVEALSPTTILASLGRQIVEFKHDENLIPCIQKHVLGVDNG